MWAIFSLSAAFCWSVSNTIDKLVLTKWVKKPLTPVIISGVIWIVVSAIVYFTHGFSYLSFFNILLAILTGVLTILLYIFYFKAIQIEEASRIIPLFYIAPFFVLVLAAIFLNENFSPIKYVGIFLIIAGAILISTKKFSRISFGKAFWWMILAAGFSAVNAVLTKYLLNLTNFWTVFGYKGIGMIIGSAFVAFFYLPDLMETVKLHGKKAVVAMSTSETLAVVGILFTIIAMSVGYVTLVNTLSSVQPFFVLLITVLLSMFFPHILKEEIGKSTIILKISAIVLMFAGAILII